jgi:hypothetical protein
MTNTDAVREFEIEHIKSIARSVALLDKDDPYVTANGGIVILCGPFPISKAQVIADFYRNARNALPDCVAEIERLRAELVRLQSSQSTLELNP